MCEQDEKRILGYARKHVLVRSRRDRFDRDAKELAQATDAIPVDKLQQRERHLEDIGRHSRCEKERRLILANQAGEGVRLPCVSQDLVPGYDRDRRKNMTPRTRLLVRERVSR